MEKIRVFIVDDHQLLRDTLRMFLEKSEPIEVVGEAGNCQDAVKGALALKPEIVLMDITLPDCDGLEATVQILEQLPETKVIAVTMHQEELYLTQFLEAGGFGYVHKSAADDELIEAIKFVSKGGIFLSPRGVQVIAGQFQCQGEQSAVKKTGKLGEDISPDVLSPRERQVLALISRGYTGREIGKRLFLSTSTIETYRARLSDKLQLDSRKELVEYSIRHKIFEEDTKS